MLGCLYISDFEAWARQTQYPAWRKIAIYRDGEIIARSHLLEQRGLVRGERLERARVLFPDTRFLEQDRPFEQAVWEGVVQYLNEVTPFLSPVEPGWAFFRAHSFSDTCELAVTLRARVGLGANCSIARLAALRAAPGSVLQVKQGAVNRFLASTEVEILAHLGFEESLTEGLRLFGLTSLASLKRLTQRHLKAQFGTDGVTLYELLHPSAESERIPLYSPPATITESFDLDGAPLEWLPINHLIEKLSRRAVKRLGSRLCRRITLQLNKGAAREHDIRQRILKKPTASLGEITRAASMLLEQLLGDASEADELTLSLSGLSNRRYRQTTLFFERAPLVDAVSNLEERFPGAIRRAIVVNPDAPFPEDAVRYEPFV